MKVSRLSCLLVSMFLLSCADSDGAVRVVAEWNLSCPADTDVDCGSLADPPTCLREDEEGVVGPGWRSIVGSNGDTACTGDRIFASCEVVEQPNGATLAFLEASVGDDFAFKLRGARVDSDDGSMPESGCFVTITEFGFMYGGGEATGSCGTEEPLPMEQPCQLSNITTGDGVVEFDLECKSLISAAVSGFDVGAIGPGPTTIRFENCTGI
jgi:hypothetical protein